MTTLNQDHADLITRTFPTLPVQRIHEVAQHTYVAPDGTLSKRASSSMALGTIARGETLPTVIRPNAAITLEGLRELIATGLLTTSGTNLHDLAPGIRVEVYYPEPIACTETEQD